MNSNKTVFTLLLIAILWGCEKDNFTDPNDPKFEPEIQGIALNLQNTFQTMDHFGASGGFQDQWVGKWPNSSKEPIAKLLFSSETDGEGNPEGIGLSLWRTIIGDGAADQVESGFTPNSWFRETECFLDEEGVYDYTKQEGEQWFLSKAREYGVTKFSAWATTPPYFMTENGYTFRTDEVNGFNCPEENYEAYATFLADVLKNYEDQGYNFETVCAFNETQYEWSFAIGEASQSGTQAFNSEVATVTRIMDGIFTEKGVNAKIMIPEAAQLTYLYEGNQNTTNQIDAFFNPSSEHYVGDLDNLSSHVAGHSYFSNSTTNQSLTQRKSLRSKIEGTGGGLDYWQTEYSLLGAAYQQGQDPSTLEEIDYALWLSRIIHTDLVHGNATGWSFWTALNQSTFGDHPFRFNLILYEPNSDGPSHTDGTFYDVKNLWALGNFSRFVRPGMVRFEVVDPDFTDDNEAAENFMISGYTDATSKEIVLVLINNLEESRKLNFEGYAELFELENDSFDVYTTSMSSNLKKSTVNYDNVNIPPKSIVTLTGKLE
ncbi:hypothetical protein FGM00_05180 [Aggregatimonas sangjinii]|uniref:Endo-beta-1,6-galactanase-like domain-containing protein n=1 Tax=Aggregatimonas sangjinii TaxID=2583587 RepID=A0A5B7SRA8_9FLAO|nr:glycoside hydrolase [Aggregatimonas sangjinii]QCW99530.1 hypothetical protein FGM00_05180 [Aggregatimonas sangjinii]